HNLPALAELQAQLPINDAANRLLFQSTSVLSQGWNGIGIERLQSRIFLFHHQMMPAAANSTSARSSMRAAANDSATVQEVDHTGKHVGSACPILLGEKFPTTADDIASIQPALMSAEHQLTFFALCRHRFCNSSALAAMPNSAGGVLLPLTNQTAADGSCFL